MAVVMVDGWPTDKVEEASRLARESGINIFFITIEGASENEKQYMLEPNFANKVRLLRKVCKWETHPIKERPPLHTAVAAIQAVSPVFFKWMLSSFLGRRASSERLVSLEPGVTPSKQHPTSHHVPGELRSGISTLGGAGSPKPHIRGSPECLS